MGDGYFLEKEYSELEAICDGENPATDPLLNIFMGNYFLKVNDVEKANWPYQVFKDDFSYLLCNYLDDERRMAPGWNLIKSAKKYHGERGLQLSAKLLYFEGMLMFLEYYHEHFDDIKSVEGEKIRNGFCTLFRKAIELNPNHASSYVALSFFPNYRLEHEHVLIDQDLLDLLKKGFELTKNPEIEKVIARQDFLVRYLYLKQFFDPEIDEKNDPLYCVGNYLFKISMGEEVNSEGAFNCEFDYLRGYFSSDENRVVEGEKLIDEIKERLGKSELPGKLSKLEDALNLLAKN